MNYHIKGMCENLSQIFDVDHDDDHDDDVDRNGG